MLSDRSRTIIEQAAEPLPRPVRLVLFTTDTGCDTCAEMQDVAILIKQKFDRLALERYDLVMDRDKSQLYGVRHAPTLVIEGAQGAFVAIQGLVRGVWLQVVLDTIKAVSRGKKWFSEDVERALSHLASDVEIRAFIEEDCLQCVDMAATCLGLALENALIRTDLVIATYFPELRQKLGVTALPKIVLGKNLYLEGHVTRAEIIETVLQAEGVKAGPDKRCLVCGQPSSDTICTNCKTRIQAEAVEHKLKSQKSGRTDTSP